MAPGGRHASAFSGSRLAIDFDILPLEGQTPAIMVTLRAINAPAEWQGPAMTLYFEPDTLAPCVR